MSNKNYETVFFLEKIQGSYPITVNLPDSKSIANRMQVLASLTEETEVHIVKPSNDIQILKKLLSSISEELYTEDAGTAARFMTAVCAVRGRACTLSGSKRMQERPFAPLIEALRKLGADITSLDKEGFLPLRFGTFFQKSKNAELPGDISSQFVTALLLVGFQLPEGLHLYVRKPVFSFPYIRMTLNILKDFGISFQENETDSFFEVIIPHQKAKPLPVYEVEKDWSAASYFFALAAISDDFEVRLKGLRSQSVQGDRRMLEFAEIFGVSFSENEEGISFRSTERKPKISQMLTLDFSDCPDLVQTIALICAAQGREVLFTGVKSLRIKETDRVTALKNELAKFGITLIDEDENAFRIQKGEFKEAPGFVETYKDHRMAMAFAPLAALFPVYIQNPDVVRKSYPNFWNDFEKAGFKITSSGKD